MKNSRKSLTLGCLGGLLLLGILGIVAIALIINQIPDVSAQLPPNAAPILITIVKPLNGSDWPLDAFVPVEIVVVSEEPVTEIAYWVDGVRREVQVPPADADPTHIFTQWTWVLGVEGDHSLVVRARAADDQTSTSNVIHVTATPAVGYNVLVPVEEGDTLESLAEEYGRTPGEIVSQNPGLDPGTSVLPGQRVLIPQASFPMPPVGAAGPPAMPQGPVQPAANQPPNALGFWLRTNLGGAEIPPAAPELSYGMTGCRVDLVVVDKSDNETGFFVYRADGQGTAFERIATLKANDGPLALQYSDEDVGGSDHRDYYAAAFNGAGETPSNPISVDITDPACQPEGANGLKMDGRDIILPDPMDAVYFYFSINKGPYERFPADSLQFLTPDDDRVSVQPILDTRLAESLPAAEALDLEVWGWVGGALTEIGRLRLSLDYTSLTMCSLGKNCTGDVASGFRTTNGHVAWDKEDRAYEFYWATNAPDTTGGLWQISLQPFSEGDGPDALPLVATGRLEQTTGWRFTVDFAEVAQNFPTYSACRKSMAATADYLDIHYPPCMLYVRIFPMAGSQPAGPPSNTVVIEYSPSEPPTIEPIIEDHLPERYQVEIQSFSLERPPTLEGWGCVYIKELPDYQQVEDYYVQTAMMGAGNLEKSREDARDAYDKWKAHMDRNEPLCPMKYTPPGVDSSWLEDLWEGVSAFPGALEDAWNLIVDVFNQIKSGLVDMAAQLIDALPGLSCNDVCRAGLKTGLEMAIAAYTGIPPSLPNFDELMDKGIDYAIELAAAEAGVPCSGQCASFLRDGLKDLVTDLKQDSSMSQPGCMSQDVAHAWFHEPLCLAPGVISDPMPGSMYEPATVVVRVSRPSPDPLAYRQVAYEYEGQPAYAVKLTFTATNDRLVGQTLTYRYKYTGDPIPEFCSGGPFNPQGSFDPEICLNKHLTMEIPVTEPLHGQVLWTEMIPVPSLQPGQTITIPVALEQARYLIPEHAAKLEEWMTKWNIGLKDLTTNTDATYNAMLSADQTDWRYLYYGSTIEAKAEVVCLSLSQPGLIGQSVPGADSVLVPCGSEHSVIVQETTPMAWLP